MFQVTWLICVADDNMQLVIGITVVNLVVHWKFIASRQQDFLLWVVVISGAGILLDGSMFQLGILQNSDAGRLPPYWLVFLWLNFSLALRYCFGFLQRNLWLACAIGAVAGPFSYYCGTLLNDSVTLQPPLYRSLLILVVTWACFLPAAASLARSACFRRAESA
ncbi:DUF2878 domain-containing protein [Microbulbifer hainanensis]|uniref:DUF2878 domain-containing protein n=1 Tax=Microbulbifer hainanensis TaxID=2735675 RepID=UPI0018679236|nr:DUF2878 domain-containing protein [Microbulbifer hainanensis]